jgi:hypothetical protein
MNARLSHSGSTASFLRARRLASALFLAGLLPAAVHAEAINGAIYTSTADGTTVNANLYATKDLVYLNGGPSNANCLGGDLDNGSYYFQVTDPSGASLLSSDGIGARSFTVAGGLVSTYTGGSHLTAGPNPPCGSLAIQLVPYADTPNGGGVYKVWITRIDDFNAACAAAGQPGGDCGLAGFVSGNTKTDNFRTRDSTTDTEEEFGSVQAVKFYDANANGVFDGTDSLLPNWEMTLGSVQFAINSTKVTDGAGTAVWDTLSPGSDYSVLEGAPIQGNWYNSGTIYVGHDGSPQNPAGPLTVTVNETTTVAFGNYCLVPSNGRTLGFWSNKNGQAALNDGGSMASELALLSGLNLRNANGSNFDPGNYAALKSWLLSATATNMAYMLSAQLATMELNVEAGYVNGNLYYPPYGGTINSLMTAANASLGSDGLTVSAGAVRTYQEQLKNALDALNNGAGVVPATPCAYSF